MRSITIVLALLLCASAFAFDVEGFTAVPKDQIRDLRRILSDGTKACLKVALDAGRIPASNYHLDKVNEFLYKNTDEGTEYLLSIRVSDNADANNAGTIEGHFSLKTNDKLHLLDYAVGEDFPKYDASL